MIWRQTWSQAYYQKCILKYNKLIIDAFTNKWTLKILDSNFNTNYIDIDNFLIHKIFRLVIFKKLFELAKLF